MPPTWTFNPWKPSPSHSGTNRLSPSVVAIRLRSFFFVFFSHLFFFINLFRFLLKCFFFHYYQQYLCEDFFKFFFLQVLWINWSLYTKAWVSHAIWALGGRGEEEEGRGEKSWKESRGPLTLTSGCQRAMQKEGKKKERWMEVWEVKAWWCKWRETERWDRQAINK